MPSTIWSHSDFIFFDIESYSEAGYRYDPASESWIRAVNSGNKKGISLVGAHEYSRHKSTEILCASFDKYVWAPGDATPVDIFAVIENGAFLVCFNAAFEFCMWNNVCTRMYGWPHIDMDRFIDVRAQAQLIGLPDSLKAVADVLDLGEEKDTRGKNLIRKYSIPRNPTKRDKSKRRILKNHPADLTAMKDYNIQDNIVTKVIFEKLPKQSPFEREVWLLDQQINNTGMYIDKEGLEKFEHIITCIRLELTELLSTITNGVLTNADQIDEILNWIRSRDVPLPNLQASTVDINLQRKDLPTDVHTVLRIRSMLSLSSVAKIDAIKARLADDNRIRGVFDYCGASQTGRWAGKGPQPQNLPNSGPKVQKCEECGSFTDIESQICPICAMPSLSPCEWGENAVEFIFQADYCVLASCFNNLMAAISGSLRGLFCASPGYDLIISDYSAIEAVILAMLANEQWRIDVFRTHGKIYEASAAKISGLPLEEFFRHKRETGSHHPLRNKLGKVAELASGYGGWINAWKRFGADRFFENDAEIKRAILGWRDASPNIVEYWGGQIRVDTTRRNWEFRHEYYGIEGAAIRAVLNPGVRYDLGIVSFKMVGDALLCRLPSGRCIYYHKPELMTTKHRLARDMDVYSLSFFGVNNDPTLGPKIWMRLYSYGGKLVQNIDQSIARDILAYALCNVRNKGYNIIGHVHDEIIGEIRRLKGSVEEFESCMNDLPPWAKNWPIRARGGRRCHRFGK